VWARLPFLLPCVVTCCIPATGFVLAALLLKEPPRHGRGGGGKAEARHGDKGGEGERGKVQADQMAAGGDKSCCMQHDLETLGDWEAKKKQWLCGGEGGEGGRAGGGEVVGEEGYRGVDKGVQGTGEKKNNTHTHMMSESIWGAGCVRGGGEDEAERRDESGGRRCLVVGVLAVAAGGVLEVQTTTRHEARVRTTSVGAGSESGEISGERGRMTCVGGGDACGDMMKGRRWCSSLQQESKEAQQVRLLHDESGIHTDTYTETRTHRGKHTQLGDGGGAARGEGEEGGLDVDGDIEMGKLGRGGQEGGRGGRRALVGEKQKGRSDKGGRGGDIKGDKGDKQEESAYAIAFGRKALVSTAAYMILRLTVIG
jgi:hypothetical protein